MQFSVEKAINGFTVKVDDSEDVHVAKNAKDVSKVIVSALGETTKPPKAKPGRKPRGKNKKKAVAAAANADTLSGLNP